MRKNWKRVASAALAATLVIGTVTPIIPVNAAVDTDALEDGEAYLSINNADWADFDAEYTTVVIDGDGDYTVSMTAAEAQNLAQFNALQVKNGESVLGNGCVLTVTEIKLNGEAIELQGDSYTCSVDGAGIDTRVNLYNEWNSPVDGDGVVASDVRAVGNPSETTAMLWTTEQLEGVQSVEVSFTVSDYGTFVETDGEDAEIVLSEDAGRAYLNINKPDWSEFEREATDVVITGDGTYTVSMTMAEPIDLGDFNALEIVEGEYLGNGSVVEIDEIKLNGEAIELQGASYTCSADGAGVTTRVNLYNAYNDPVDADGNVGADFRSYTDPTECSARLIADEDRAGVSEIEVTFTVSDFGVFIQGDPEEEVAELEEFDANGVYHAYIGFQSPTYSFRNAWDGEDGYGHETPEFSQVTGWGEGNEELTIAGSFVDAELAGNGTYTVEANGLEFITDDWTQDHMNLIFFSTDIPNVEGITFSDIKLTVNNGSEMSISKFVIPEDNSYIRVMIQNIWDTDNGIDTIAYYPVPVTDLKITFTVSGFAYDKVEEAAPAEETAAEAPAATDAPAADDATQQDDTKGGSKGVIAGVIGGIVVVGGGAAAFVLGRKKK